MIAPSSLPTSSKLPSKVPRLFYSVLCVVCVCVCARAFTELNYFKVYSPLSKADSNDACATLVSLASFRNRVARDISNGLLRASWWTVGKLSTNQGCPGQLTKGSWWRSVEGGAGVRCLNNSLPSRVEQLGVVLVCSRSLARRSLPLLCFLYPHLSPNLPAPPPPSCLHSSFSFLTGRLYIAFHRLVCSFQRLVCHFRDSCEHFRGSCVHFRDSCAANIQALLQLHLIPHPPSSVFLSPTYNSPHPHFTFFLHR